jgi:recombinational DNA repair protein RecT
MTRQTTALARYRETVSVAAQQFATSLPTTVGPDVIERVTERMLTAFREGAARDSNLLKCSPTSIGRAVALSAYTGLMPGGPRPDVFLYPRKSKGGGLELQWDPSWRGLKRLIERDGGVVLHVELVFDGEHFAIRHEGARTLVSHHADPFGPRSWDTLCGGYVRAVTPTGVLLGTSTMSKAEIEQNRKASDSYRKGYGPWIDWPLRMARKTLVRDAYSKSIVPADGTVDVAYEAIATDAADAVEVEPVEVSSGAAALEAHLDAVEQGAVEQPEDDDAPVEGDDEGDEPDGAY